MTPGGLWDSRKYEIKALVKYKGEIKDAAALDYAGPSTFQKELTVGIRGDYEVIVYAFDPLTGNTGVDKVKVKVE